MEVVNPTQTWIVADKGQRFVNFIIDSLVIHMLMTPFRMFMWMGGFFSFHYMYRHSGITMLISIVYYTFMEATYGQSLGKMVTRTRVINERDGSRIDMKTAFLRSICRLIPFDGLFIFFLEKNATLHDRLPNTAVVKA